MNKVEQERYWAGFHKEMELATKAIERISLAFNNLSDTWREVINKGRYDRSSYCNQNPQV